MYADSNYTYQLQVEMAHLESIVMQIASEHSSSCIPPAEELRVHSEIRQIVKTTALI